jgi:hypothetical protein
MAFFRPALTASAVLLFAAGAAAQPSVSTKGPNDPSFRLINQGKHAITEVFATPAGRSNWGKNRLDQDTLKPEAAHVFVLPKDGNCIYDIKVVFAGGRTRERKGTNLCKLSDLPVGEP